MKTQSKRTSHTGINQTHLLKISRVRQKVVGIVSLCSIVALAVIIGMGNGFGSLVQAMSINSITTNSGSIEGGNEVTITGEGFLKTITQTDEIIEIAGGTAPVHNDRDIEIDPNIYTGASIALTKNGKVYTWGSNLMGAAGVGKECAYTETSPDVTDPYCYYFEPQDITNSFDERVIHVYQISDQGEIMNIAITINGHVYVWGVDCLQSIYGDPAASKDSRQRIDPPHYNTPTKIDYLSNYQVSSLLPTPSNSILLQSGTTIYIPIPNESDHWVVQIDLTDELNGLTMAPNGVAIGNFGNYGNIIILTTSGKIMSATVGQCSETECSVGDLTDISGDFGNKSFQQIIQMDNGLVFALSTDGQMYDLGSKTDVSTQMGIDGISSMVNALDYRGLVVIANGMPYEVDYVDNQYQAYPLNDLIGSTDVRLLSTASVRHGDAWQHVAKANPSKVCSIIRPMIPTSTVSTGIAKRNDVEQPQYQHCVDIPLETTTQQIPTITAISFGDATTTNFTVIDNNTIKVIVPAHAAGKVDVTLHSVDGDESNIAMINGYEYLLPAGIGAPNAGSGSAGGGLPLIIGTTLASSIVLLFVVHRTSHCHK